MFISSYSVIYLFLVVCVYVTVSNAQSRCKVRKEIRNLSHSERDAMMNGYRAMYSDGTMERLRQTHSANLAAAHNTDYFLLWHRSFMIDVENELMSHTSGISGLPYQDLSLDAANPANSPAFSPEMFGTLNSGCIKPFAVDGQCVTRNNPTGNWGACANGIVASLIKNADDYTTFSRSFEGTCHNRIHSTFPGSTLYAQDTSSADPYFHPFHAGVDYFFVQWQNQHSKPGNIDLNRQLLGKSVSQLFTYSEGNNCYTYEGVSPPSSGRSNSNSRTIATTSTPLPSSTSTITSSPTPIPTISTSTVWIPEFERIPKEWFDQMPGMFTTEQIEEFNRIYASAIQYLKRLQAEGKHIPTMDDFKSITGNEDWTERGIKKLKQKGASADVGNSSVISSSLVVGMYGPSISLLLAFLSGTI